jgi:hypothetical protein
MGRDMSDDIFGPAFEVWKSELDAINQEASLLLAAARQPSVEERRALQSQCAALLERRNTAVRNLALQSEYAALIERRNTDIRNVLNLAFPHRHSIASEKPAELTGQSTAQKETAALNRDDAWVGDKPAEDDCQTLPSHGIDKNFAPQARKLGVLSNVKFEEVVAAARDTVTRASRTVMRTLGIKSGREGEAAGAARVKQAIANDSCFSDGPSIQPPQVSVVDRSPDATIEASSEPSLNSDLKDELTRILSGEKLDHDLDARRLNTPAAV